MFDKLCNFAKTTIRARYRIDLKYYAATTTWLKKTGLYAQEMLIIIKRCMLITLIPKIMKHQFLFSSKERLFKKFKAYLQQAIDCLRKDLVSRYTFSVAHPGEGGWGGQNPLFETEPLFLK